MTKLNFRNHYKIDTPINEPEKIVTYFWDRNLFNELAEKVKGVKPFKINTAKTYVVCPETGVKTGSLPEQFYFTSGGNSANSNRLENFLVWCKGKTKVYYNLRKTSDGFARCFNFKYAVHLNVNNAVTSYAYSEKNGASFI
jgi:hypothetical protein